MLSFIEKGKNLILEIDYQGAFAVQRIFNSICSIFILPPSMKALEERLNSRGKDSKRNIQKRLAMAKHEMSHLDKFDYVIINEDFKRALDDLRSIITLDLRASTLEAKKQIQTHQGLIETLKK